MDTVSNKLNTDLRKDSTLDRAYTQLISALTDSSQDHITLADSFSSQVIEPLKATERKYDEMKKKQMQHYQKLLAERDRLYADRMKVRLIFVSRCACAKPFLNRVNRRCFMPPLAHLRNVLIHFSTMKNAWR